MSAVRCRKVLCFFACQNCQVSCLEGKSSVTFLSDRSVSKHFHHIQVKEGYFTLVSICRGLCNRRSMWLLFLAPMEASGEYMVLSIQSRPSSGYELSLGTSPDNFGRLGAKNIYTA